MTSPQAPTITILPVAAATTILPEIPALLMVRFLVFLAQLHLNSAFVLLALIWPSFTLQRYAPAHSQYSKRSPEGFYFTRLGCSDGLSLATPPLLRSSYY